MNSIKLPATIYLFLTFLFTCTVLHTSAHFGSKGPYGGTVSCSITNDSTVYLGTANGGVFESTSSKLVGWRPRPVGLKSGKITALAHSGKDLYAATADSGIYIFTGYVGSDRYWKKINNGLSNLKIKSLLAIDSVTLLAGTEGNGIFKSVNKGATWTPVANTTLNTDVITGLAKAKTRIILTSLNKGIFISDDKGETWKDFNDVNTLNIAGTTALSYNEATNELAIINQNGIFVTGTASSSLTAAYTMITTGLPANTDIRFISNSGSGWLLATNKGVFTTLAGTINWTSINTGLLTLDVNTVIPFQSSLVTGTKGEGIFKASMAAPSWIATNFGFNNIITYSMASSGITVVVAATEKGIFVSKDLANSYKKCNKGLTDSLNVTDVTFWGTKLVAATKNAGVFVSNDTGTTWTPLNAGLSVLNIQKIIASPAYLYLFNSNGEIYRSQASNWTLIQTGLPAAIKPTSLAFYGNKVALGTLGNGVYTSNVGTIQWFAFNQGLSTLNVTSVASQHHKLFAGTIESGVFVTDTATAGWSTTAPTTIAHTTLIGLNGKHIQALNVYAGYVFASYKGGLLATSNYGATWIEGGNQFNLPSYTNVNKIEFVTTRVFVTTEHNSLYSNALSELPPVGIAEHLNDIGDFTVYPNPSNGNFMIDLTTIKSEVKQVNIYDQQGKKVTFIQPHPSLHTLVKIQAAAGIYCIQIVTNEGSTTQKIIIE